VTTKKRAPAKGVKKKRVTRVGDPIDVAIKNFEQKLRNEELKLADYLRLLQVKKEREEHRPRTITVRWIENREKEPATEK